MSPRTQAIEQEIKELSLDEMVVLYDHLMATIQERESAEGLDEERKETIERRTKEIDAGSVEGQEAFSVIDQL